MLLNRPARALRSRSTKFSFSGLGNGASLHQRRRLQYSLTTIGGSDTVRIFLLQWLTSERICTHNSTHTHIMSFYISNGPRCEKTGLRGFRPGPTKTGLYSHRRWLEARNFGLIQKRNCTIQVAKTKALISFAVTAKLIFVFVFAYAKIRFSHVS